MDRVKVKSIEELPYILNAKDLSEFLGISRSGAYELLKRGDFPSISVGKRRFVSKMNLLSWVNKNTPT